jgi:hypothetical protein
LFTEAFDQLPTKKMRTISLPGPPEFTLGQERWSGSIVPPAPTVHTAIADPEQYEQVKQYMFTNLRSGFATPDVLRMTQSFAEALLREKACSLGILSFSPRELVRIATTINQVAVELEIAPRGYVNASP